MLETTRISDTIPFISVGRDVSIIAAVDKPLRESNPPMKLFMFKTAPMEANNCREMAVNAINETDRTII